jgi:predicted PurR-regulated permease PerM
MRMVRQMPAPGQGRVPMTGGGTCRRRGGGAGADIPSVTKNDDEPGGVGHVWGLATGLALWGLGMPHPWLWGGLTVLLEFIPYLGAAGMIGLLAVTAFGQFDRLGYILLDPASYLVITTLQNNLVSPFVYGQRLPLNPVAVFVGVLFWWYLWGVAGAFLAVPVFTTLKIVAEHVEGLAPIAIFLGE